MTENDGMLGHIASRTRTVLIVDDSTTVAANLEVAAMEIPGVEVILAETGADALRVMAEGQRTVDAIITDLNMPRMDGFEFIARVRSGGDRTPIIVISADTDPGTPARLRHLGADAFFAKPYSPTQVCRKLEQLLNGSTM